MTKKQMKKVAQEIIKCEHIHQNASSSKEEKIEASNKVMHLTNMILSLKNGVNIMLEIDTIIQELINK